MDEGRATAFVPGHVTAFFSACPADRPAAAGSRGAGLALTDGVEVTVEMPSTDGRDMDGPALTSLTLNGERATIGAVADVLDGLDVRGRVALETPLPVGAGFGVSGAAALGTALAANAAADRGRSGNELVRLAHVAEVERGTGLGDVVAQARGGVPIRLAPGAPGHGELDGIPARARVEYVTFGELSTEDVLAGDTDGLSAAGDRALDRLRADPRLPTLMDAARVFAERADLLVPEVAEAMAAVEAIESEGPDVGDGAVEAAGSDRATGAAMAMLGRTVFALGTGLSDAGYAPEVCRIDPAGSRLVGDGVDARE
jgi:pantoate kinase